ncbi:DUF456 domain-containing protein [Natronospora cellulosivora (SeqCode)]
MIILGWIIIVFLFILSLIGVIVPIIPATIPLWVGLLLYHFAIAELALSLSFWLGMFFITILILASDFYTNVYFVRKYGGSKWAVLGAALGLFLGLLIFGPFGIILGPLLAVFLITYIESNDHDKAFKTAIGTIFAFFSSGVIKIVLQVIMIIWFFISI